MTPQIIGRYGWHADHEDLRQMLGLGEKAKLPTEGMPSRFIQGIEVWVAPLSSRPANVRHKRSTHRVLARCPECERILSAGRLHQHRCKP